MKFEMIKLVDTNQDLPVLQEEKVGCWFKFKSILHQLVPIWYLEFFGIVTDVKNAHLLEPKDKYNSVQF